MSAQQLGVGFVLFGNVQAALPAVFAGGWEFHRAKDNVPETWFKVNKNGEFQPPFYEGITHVTLFLMGTPKDLKGFALERFLIWHKEMFGEKLVQQPSSAPGPRPVSLPGR